MADSKRYTLFKKIARGGMAEIFLGKQTGEDGFQRVCCIKRILPHFAQDTEFIEMFRDEAHIGKRLQHANIVRVEGFEEVQGSYALIMEFVNGGDLRGLLAACESQGQRLSVPMALHIIAEAARGLHFAHSKIDEVSGRALEIVHRDISPQNILLSFEGEVKVTDFGIAAADSKSGETKTGIVKGKYAYMSPEQISGKTVDARTDVFALAVVLWEILAMHRLFQGDSEVETIQKVRNCELDRDLRELNPEVDTELYHLVLKGLQPSPGERYASAADMETRLRRYVSSRYSDFTLSDLSSFIKTILATRLQERQQELKALLSQEVSPVTVTAKTQLNPFSSDFGLEKGPEKAAELTLEPAAAPQFTLKGGTQSRLSAAASGLRPLAPAPAQGAASGGAGAGKAEVAAPRKEAARTGGVPLPRRDKVGVRSGPRAPRKPPAASRSLFYLLGAALLVLGGVGGYLGDFPHFFSSTAERLTLQASPTELRVGYQGRALFNNRYVKAPLVLAPSRQKGVAVLTSAQQESERVELQREATNVFTFSRRGFKDEELRLQGQKIVGGEKYIVLEKKVDMAPTRIRLQGARESLWVEVDAGEISTEISPGEIYDAHDLTFGEVHTLYVYPQGQKNQNAAFTCRFVPRSQDWTAPYMIVVQVNQQSCTYPPR